MCEVIWVSTGPWRVSHTCLAAQGSFVIYACGVDFSTVSYAGCVHATCSNLKDLCKHIAVNVSQEDSIPVSVTNSYKVRCFCFLLILSALVHWLCQTCLFSGTTLLTMVATELHFSDILGIIQ